MTARSTIEKKRIWALNATVLNVALVLSISYSATTDSRMRSAISSPVILASARTSISSSSSRIAEISEFLVRPLKILFSISRVVLAA